MRRIGRATLAACVLAAVFATGLLAAAPAGAATVAPDAEADFVARTNALRAAHGLAPLAVDDDLTAKARDWAQSMAAAGSISHSNLSDNVHSDWHRLGENVGSGPDVASIHDALVNSPSHLANLLDPGFRFVGVGVVNADGTIFVSEVFMELASQPAPSTSASAAGTPPSTRAPRAAPTPERAPAPEPVATPEPEPPRRVVDAPVLDAALARLRRTEL